MALLAATASPPQPRALHCPRPTTLSTSLFPSLCIPLLRIHPFLLSLAKLRPRTLRFVPRITAYATAAPAGPDFMDVLERCFSLPSASEATSGSSPSATPAALRLVIKGGKYGAIGAVTLEKYKLDLSKETMRSIPETAIGGGGGDIGKINGICEFCSNGPILGNQYKANYYESCLSEHSEWLSRAFIGRSQ